MFEITGDDIELLNDENLRAVIARLCEAELRGRGYSASYVTWGGNQNAADGGIDVRVALPPDSVIDGFIPRPSTVFQVKQQDVSVKKIGKEMRPRGKIRPSIQDLADHSGAYIIVSSKGSITDTSLINRRNAMRSALKDARNADKLNVDFYDRTQIATWARNHEGLIPWIRTLIGKSIPGWQSYGPWAYATDSLISEYLLDNQLRIHNPQHNTDKGISALDGIQKIRDELNQVQHIVRLVGLSGVGKTRLVQALFDGRIGTHSLDPSQAIYTNMADDPNPQPIGLASDLIAAGTRAILVIDNCPSELHGRLSEICRQPKSKTSLITVEYDIREDEKEGTEVFTLEGSSSALIEKLIRQHFRQISQIDAHTIAEFSGGNARIAIALAATVEHSGTVAGLTDEELFQRLFTQRHAHDESLYLSAQACALLYSFQGEDVSESDRSELALLGKLIGKTPQELYRAVAELQRRDLVQQRSIWSAVLPQAIANRLAATALQNIPYTEIENNFLKDSSLRLMKSFSRRLGYLHACKEAVTIVRNWLAVDGLLGNVTKLNEIGQSMFEYVAPCEPEAALAALERALFESSGSDEVKGFNRYYDLVRRMAYQPELFNRCIKLMVQILTDDDVSVQSYQTQNFVVLFQLNLSGTHASIEQRAAVIEWLLSSNEEKQRALGVMALKASLETWQFHSVGSFEFGARTRDFGYRPHSKEEVQHWFSTSLKLAETFACSNQPIAPQVLAALAEKFHWL
jgi:hypothetical protein